MATIIDFGEAARQKVFFLRIQLCTRSQGGSGHWSIKYTGTIILSLCLKSLETFVKFDWVVQTISVETFKIIISIQKEIICNLLPIVFALRIPDPQLFQRNEDKSHGF